MNISLSGIKSKLGFGKKSVTMQSRVDLQPGSWLEYVFGGSGKVTATQAMNFYQNTSAVATSVDMIAGSFEQIQPVLHDRVKNTYDKYNDVIAQLENPNPFQTWFQFAGQLSRHYLLTGNSHSSALGNVRFKPIELYSVKPQLVSVTENNTDGFPRLYHVTQGAGNGVYNRVTSKGKVNFYDKMNLLELYHIMMFSSRFNNVQGDSPLDAAALEAKQLIQGKTHNLSLLNSGGRLSLLVAFKGDPPDDDEHQQRKKRIREDLGGPNGEKIAVVAGEDVTIEELGVNNKDMDYATLQDMASLSIYQRYKIPLPLVTTDASSFNNFEKSLEALYDWAVLPMADVLMGGMSQFLLPRYKLDLERYRITYDPESITALMNRRLEQLKKRVEMNLETRNELRDELPNRDTLGPEHDVIYQNASLLPVGDEMFMDQEVEVEKLLKQENLEE